MCRSRDGIGVHVDGRSTGCHDARELATGGHDGRVDMSETQIVECPTSEGCHYDYDRQTWLDGHDHYHVRSGSIARLYCGQALAGCKRASGYAS